MCYDNGKSVTPTHIGCSRHQLCPVPGQTTVGWWWLAQPGHSWCSTNYFPHGLKRFWRHLQAKASGSRLTCLTFSPASAPVPAPPPAHVPDSATAAAPAPNPVCTSVCTRAPPPSAPTPYLTPAPPPSSHILFSQVFDWVERMTSSSSSSSSSSSPSDLNFFGERKLTLIFCSTMDHDPFHAPPGLYLLVQRHTEE